MLTMVNSSFLDFRVTPLSSSGLGMVMMFMAREVVTNPSSGGQGDLYNSSGGQGESPCCETLEADVERR